VFAASVANTVTTIMTKRVCIAIDIFSVQKLRHLFIIKSLNEFNFVLLHDVLASTSTIRIKSSVRLSEKLSGGRRGRVSWE
jgi:hypothetical protein